ncbi:MAG: peptidylprolyl isomerase [Eubacteriales bacterium]|nr:peptidylprolyl isomerase [Eubacteriales bacterium]
MDSGHRIVVELDDRFAKKTVENFQKLVADHFYDGLIFHRVIDGFMIQGGDPDGTGRGGASEKIEGEFELNGVENPLSHRRGVISMARSMDPNSASSQFFICNADTPQLDGQYASFGWVIYGMGEVDRIAKLEKDDMDRPTTPPVIKEIRFLSKSSAEALLEKLAEAK